MPLYFPAKVSILLCEKLSIYLCQKMSIQSYSLHVVSNAKIKAALGMKEMPVRAKDGLRETIKSFAEK